MEKLKPYAKALALLALIVVVAILDALGVETGLDIAHYVGLLVADVAVWAVPNKGYVDPSLKAKSNISPVNDNNL